MKRGRENPDWGGLKTLYHTIRGDKANNWGLKLDLDDKFIYQSFESEEIMEKDVCWVLSDLGERLTKKHRETFWVEVDTRVKGNENFTIKRFYIQDIDLSMIPTLIKTEYLLDYLLWERRKLERIYQQN